jgi:alanine racemase
MVKAAGYGTGSVEIAKTLQDRGVDYLAVAVADEGVELRRAGITANIMVMNPEKATLHTLFQYNLEPEVYSFSMLEMLIRAAGAEGVTDFPIHLKLDTGMHRLGFSPRRDMPRLIDRLLHQNALTPRSVFSHFVGADSPGFDEFSAQQFQLFTEGAQTLQTAFPHHILRHICNSAGIERFHERHLDMVRLGIGLYGIDPIDNRVLHNVATLRTTILQIHEIPAGESIGYSRRTFTDRPTRIAVLPIGYADGLDRRLGNRVGHCLVDGKPAPYMGNICMDVCMIDVTDIPCNEGDSVEIFGDHLPISTLSDTLGTIPYEILTSVGGRIKRVYLQE